MVVVLLIGDGVVVVNLLFKCRTSISKEEIRREGAWVAAAFVCCDQLHEEHVAGQLLKYSFYMGVPGYWEGRPKTAPPPVQAKTAAMGCVHYHASPAPSTLPTLLWWNGWS